MSEYKNIPAPSVPGWDENVDTAAQLPLTNNQIGDKREALDTQALYSWNGTGWTAIASPAAAIAVTALIGDVTGTGPGATSTTLKTVNLNVGEFGDAANAATFTVNGKGLITAASENPIQIAQSQVDNLITDLAGKFDDPTGTTAQYIRGDGSLATFPSYIDTAGALVTTIWNDTGAPLTAGTVVYISGEHGNLPTVTKAQANNDANSARTYGIVSATIAHQASGTVIRSGRLVGLNTNGFLPGTSLYLSPTVAGEYTATKPSAPNHMVYVATVVRQHNAQGSIEVQIQNGYELEELHDVSIASTPADGDILTYELATSLWKNKPNNAVNKLTKGTKTIFCIDNGDYATGQAAIDAAAAGDTILFGVKQGGWGNLVIPAGKTLSLVGLNNPRYPGTTIQIGSITFNPTTGLNPNLNELHLANLYILSPAGTSAITFGGSAPARLRVDGCYIYSNTVTGIVINNTDATFTSARFQDCEIQSSTATNTHISATSRYVTFNRCTFGNGNKVIDVVAGVVELSLCRLEVNSASAIVTASSTVAPTFLSIGSCLIANSTTNGSGVALTKGAPALNFVNLSNVFTIAGTGGFCVSGTGTHAYSYPTFTGANTRFVTTPASVTLTTTPTLV